MGLFTKQTIIGIALIIETLTVELSVCPEHVWIHLGIEIKFSESLTLNYFSAKLTKNRTSQSCRVVELFVKEFVQGRITSQSVARYWWARIGGECVPCPPLKVADGNVTSLTLSILSSFVYLSMEVHMYVSIHT